jgi:hypothetical protein
VDDGSLVQDAVSAASTRPTSTAVLLDFNDSPLSSDRHVGGSTSVGG